MFERRLDHAGVPLSLRPDYHQSARQYLEFCERADYAATAPTALGPFLTELAHKGHSIDQRHDAAKAVRLLTSPDPRDPTLYQHLSGLGSPSGLSQLQTQAPTSALRPRPASWQREYRDLEAAIKLRNYSRRTLEAYRFWMARFQAFVRSRPTAQLGNHEVRGFLSSLAVQHGISASSHFSL